MSASISVFFTNKLGANLKNPRWSWGAVDPISNRVFLRVWADQIDVTPIGKRVQVDWDQPHTKSLGIAERREHIERIRYGAEGYGVVCEATDTGAEGVRKILKFDCNTVLRFSGFMRENERTYAMIDRHVPVDDLLRQRTGQGSLVQDLNAISNQKIDATTKTALVDARVGQGQFRSQVLKLWGNVCAVTGAVTLDAVRASHIKPWKDSTDSERLDPHNGLPLIANYDALFDAGLISFESTGEMIYSPQLSVADWNIFVIGGCRLRQKISEATSGYLQHHRHCIFRGRTRMSA